MHMFVNADNINFRHVANYKHSRLSLVLDLILLHPSDVMRPVNF